MAQIGIKSNLSHFESGRSNFEESDDFLQEASNSQLHN